MASIVTSLILLLGLGPAADLVPRSPHVAAQEAVAHPGDSSRAGAGSAIRTAFDSLARRTMERGRVPGLALVLVREGEVAWSEGYGRASLETGRPVSPGSTRFPVGSVSKLVTAVLAMQLVEEGRLGLDDDIRAHLRDPIRLEGPGGPVTLHHLLTHTAGLEPASIGLAARAPGQVEPLGQVMLDRIPRRTWPPGLIYLYSQFDYGLVGLVARTVTGRPFERLVEQRVFSPLGMENTRLRPEAPGHELAATGYHWSGEGFEPAPTAYHQIPPAGGMVSTPLDVGRLLAAFLGEGRASSDRILGEETVERMLSRQWSPHPDPRVEGTGYGLFEYRACGVRALSTRGWVGGHSAYLHLVPGHDTGFLVVGNASGLQGLESSLRLALHDRLPGARCEDGERTSSSHPRDAPPGREAGRPDPTDAASLASGSGLTGVYRSIGFASRGVEALGRLLLSPTLEVRAEGEGLVLDLGGRVVPADRVGGLLLRAPWGPAGDEYFSFLEDDGGEPRFLAWEGSVYEKIPGYGRPAVLRTLVGLAGLVFLSGLAVGLGRWLSRAWGRSTADDSGDGRRWLRASVYLLSFLPLAFTAGMALHLGGTARYQFAFGIPATALPLLWLPAIWTALALGLALMGIESWREGHGSAWERLHGSLVVATGLVSGVGLAMLGILPTW